MRVLEFTTETHDDLRFFPAFAIIYDRDEKELAITGGIWKWSFTLTIFF
jgi:hypothetical protein